MKKILFLLLLILFASPVLATVTCNPTQITTTYESGTSPPTQSTTCTNNDVNNSVTINKLGQYFQTTPSTPITINPLEVKEVTISFDGSAPAGTYYGALHFSDNSPQVPITINVKSSAPKGTCDIDVFPTIMSNVKVQQGMEKTKQVLVTLPSCYADYIDMRAVILQSDEKPIELGELMLGRLQPGDSVQIPIVFDATDVSTGTYSETLEFNLANSSGIRLNVPSVSISVRVTKGISPQTNFSILPDYNFPPSIVVSQAFEIRATNVFIDLQPALLPNPDIKVLTNALDSAGNWVLRATTNKTGNLKIQVVSYYRGSQIGSVIEKVIPVTGGGTLQQSANITVIYFPTLDVFMGGLLAMQCRDSKSNNAIPCDFYINNIQIEGNSFNASHGEAFQITAVNPNYNTYDYLLILKKQAVSISVNPVSPTTGTFVRIGTTPDNAQVFLDGNEIGHNFTAETGTFIITAKAEGYQDGSINITVEEKIKIISAPQIEGVTLERGKKYIWELNTEAENFKVIFENQQGEEEVIETSNTTVLSFIPTKVGYYYIEAGGKRLGSYQVKPSFALDWRWIVYPLIAITIIGLVILILRKQTGGVGYGSSSGMGEELERVD